MNLGNKMLSKLGYKQVDISPYFETFIYEEWKKFDENNNLINTITFYKKQKVGTLFSIDYEELKAIKQKFVDFRWC